MTQGTAQSLTGLAARLTKPEDREIYAGLISYFRALPEHDELFHIAELLGLLSLLGQRVPDALAEYLTELRQLTKTAGEYYGQVDCRLANLPAEIAQGMNLTAMSEAFRQQLAATGLETSAAHLRNSSLEIKTMSDQISNSLKPAAAAIAEGVAKLTAAAAELQWRTIQPADRGRPWLQQGLFALAMFLLGSLCGMLLEKVL